ncbi:STAS domain-containing protein [Solimonas flava]|uniref:STAS domain-containing protein n=1 Tax=Solimonas flava TaxID=415849 RepID=UPI0004145CF9|nr:STAS domain-containing protein [Solimonas flava]
MSTDPIRTASDATAATLELPADLGIEQLAALHAQLAPRVADAAPLTLDGGAVTRVHTAGLQLCAAFCRDRARAGLATVWREPSATLRDAARLLGLDAGLCLAEVRP